MTFFPLQIAHWAILLNLLWVLWQKSGVDQEFEEEVKATKHLKKVETKEASKDEIDAAATALMG